MTAGQRGVRPEEIDAVTIDAYGTLLELRGVVARLHALVPERSVEEVERAFEAEVEYYAAHAHEAHDDVSLARLRADCARVFNEELASAVPVEAFIAAFEFEVVDGVREALGRLRARGLSLAVVANFDVGLHEHLRKAALDDFFAIVVTAGEAGARKPDPRPFRIAVEYLGVTPERVLHVGDHAPHDEAGARAAGLRFAPAPLAQIDREWN